jgi:tripartite ATP-independent transporter DctP family solute receptor
MFRKNFGKLFAMAVILLMGSVLWLAPVGLGKENKLVLRYAEVNPESDPITRAGHKFADLVKEKTKGRIEIRIFSGGQLGGQPEQIQSAQMGALDMARSQPIYLADAGAKKLNVYSLPYLFRDQAHAWKVLESKVGQKLLKDIEDSNLRVVGIGYYATSPRHFFFRNKKVTKLSDLKGLKLRVPSGRMYMDLIRSFGASPTPIPFSDLYSALQTGVVDGAEQPIKGYFSGKYYEICKYMTFDAHQIDPSIVIVSGMLWKKLSAGDQKILKDALRESGEYFNDLSSKLEAKYVEDMRKAGVIFSKLDNPQEWQDAAKPLYEKYGAGREAIIKQMKNIK